ncbi:flagellar biosynthetic protein FliO [Acetonema longum]|uniref:Flagellar protein n=1 Tax=Acetonema longum DSM 6540 TaxID=1009370 RepID=F7NL56_9FIRM|nr:flagellar biosynthetic protein FliO [Acetonema longum]EGO63161.1 hypothetical protein ALO_14142 [Acetonema longum DSM 6540]
MSGKYRYTISVVLLFLMTAGAASAEEVKPFLQYQDLKPEGTTVLGNIFYILSVIATFALVLFIAYLTSRFVGRKFAVSAGNGENRVISTLTLGPNRGVYLVNISGRFLILGVTEHHVTLLQDITSDEMTQKYSNNEFHADDQDQFGGIFQKHLASLQQMSQGFSLRGSQHSNQSDQEKR